MGLLAEGLARHLPQGCLSRLAQAKVGIAGAGGLGSNVAALLVRSGVRHMVIADHDVVDASNLNRQWYWPEDVGQPKVHALERRLRELEPGARVEALCERLVPSTAPRVFAGCFVVVEALDNAQDKAALCAALVREGFFVAAASGLGGWSPKPLEARRLGNRLVCVGDFTAAVSSSRPALAPRVMQAAALQAGVVLACILGDGLELD